MSQLSMSATLLDISRRINDDGKVAKIIEVLNETNQMLDDMMWMECNMGTVHKTTTRNGLPPSYWRKYNKGTPQSKSTTTQITDPTAMMQNQSNVDAELVQINAGGDNGATYRASEDVAHMESMNQTIQTTLLYGSSEDTDQFVGFSERYNSYQDLSGTLDDQKTSYNVLDAGGRGADNTSLWLIGWGDQSAHGLYPQHTKAGFEMTDKGLRMVQDDDNNEFEAWSTLYKWKPGLTVRDWRHTIRIANIDVSALRAGTGADLITLMTLAEEQLPENKSGVRYAFYGNKLITTYLRLQMQDKTRVNAALGFIELQGKKVRAFGDIPIRRVDKLLLTEAAVPQDATV